MIFVQDIPRHRKFRRTGYYDAQDITMHRILRRTGYYDAQGITTHRILWRTGYVQIIFMGTAFFCTQHFVSLYNISSISTNHHSCLKSIKNFYISYFRIDITFFLSIYFVHAHGVRVIPLVHALVLRRISKHLILHNNNRACSMLMSYFPTAFRNLSRRPFPTRIPFSSV